MPCRYPFVLLFNGNCHCNESMSTKLVQRIKNIIGSLQDGGIPIAAVTTASPFIAFHVKRLFPDIQIRASVNMRISHFYGNGIPGRSIRFLLCGKGIEP